MITWKRGNLLDDDADALVNTVNCVGAMGRGIALQFRNKYPLMYEKYKLHCRRGLYSPGKCFLVKGDDGRLIINAATKGDWRYGSEIQWIESILVSLPNIPIPDISSIALPPLGCGNGGLNWPSVRKSMIDHLSSSPIDFRVYEP